MPGTAEPRTCLLRYHPHLFPPHDPHPVCPLPVLFPGGFTHLNPVVVLKRSHSLRATNTLTRAEKTSRKETPAVSRIFFFFLNQLIAYKVQVRGPPRRQTHSRSFSHTPSPPPCFAKFARRVVLLCFLRGCSDDPRPERAAAEPPRSAEAAQPGPSRRRPAAGSPPLPTGTDRAPLPVRLGRVSRLNGAVPGRAELVLLQQHSRETKAAGEQGRKGRRRLPAFLKSQPSVLSWASFPSLSGAPHLMSCGTALTKSTRLI